jgi:hypothetical protein
MKTLRTLKPGQKGTKRFLEKYQEQLVCVRYKCDEFKQKKYTTIELIAEESNWLPTHLIEVPVQIAFKEKDLRAKARSLGGRWDPEHKCWFIPYGNLKKAGLENRLICGIPQALMQAKKTKSVYQIGKN